MKPKLTYTTEKRERKGINAGDFGKLGIDIVLAIKGEEPTNPMEWTSYLRMAAGKGVELEMCKILKQNGILAEDFDQEDAPTTEIVYNGVPIRMRFDALVKEGGAILKTDDTLMPQSMEIEMQEGEPIEIKSINNKNSVDIGNYLNNKPRDNYVGQLAIYMYALNKERGHLFVSSIDGLNTFWFVCKKVGEMEYQCGDVVVSLAKEFKRFEYLWGLKDKEIPESLWSEERYKIPVEQVDWSKISVSKVGDCRNGRRVMGTENSYKILYSSYKDKIVAMQGVTLGYSEQELLKVKELTKGFSAKKK